MASFGHLAVGLLAGRLHGGAGGPAKPQGESEACASTKTLLAFAALSALPDLDVFVVAMGVPDAGAGGHRGASHSLFLAGVIGILTALYARRHAWPAVRTAVAATLAVASHGLLDAIGEGGRGIPLFWPFSAARYMSPWRVLPDAPRGLQLLSRHGLLEVCIELLVFLPMTVFALWPYRPALLRARALPVRSNQRRASVLVPKPAVAVVVEQTRR